MKSLKDQVKELDENQKHILEAIRYLNERLENILEKVDVEQIKDAKDIVESQAMIDQLLVKNSDDIKLIMKRKNDNSAAIENLEMKLDVIEKEIATRVHDIEAKLDESRKKEVLENVEFKAKTCKYFNKGFCKMQESCSHGHKSNEICENHSNGIKCNGNNCEKRHPRACRYFKRGNCWRNGSCLYLHRIQGGNMNVNEVTVDMHDIEEIDDNMLNGTANDAYTDVDKECGNCQSVTETIQCEKCEKHFCTECQLKMHGESVLIFFKSHNFINYTCNTTHILNGNEYQETNPRRGT